MKARLHRRLIDSVSGRAVAAVDYVEGRPVAPAQWLEPGLGLALLIPLGIALPFAATGPLRAALGWSLAAALPLAIVASVLVALPIVLYARARGQLAHRWAAYVVPLVFAVASVALLYRRDFAGLTNYAGADGGVHVYTQQVFVDVSPTAYVGFVSMYSLMFWIERILHCNIFWSLCAAYYFGVAYVGALPAMVLLVVLEPFSRPAWRIGLAVGAVVMLGIVFAIVLPQQHYHQTDGFFAHLFALVPLMVAWLIDCAVRARLWRWVGLIAALVFYRYTYGLNLADILTAAAVILFADSFAPGTRPLVRWSLRLLPLPLIVAALLFLKQLQPLLASYGWIINYDLRVVLYAQLFAIGAMALTLVGTWRLAPSHRVVIRAVRLPLAFAAVNAAIAYAGWTLPVRQPYYVLKYPVHAVVLSACVLAVVVAFVAARLVEEGAQRRWRLSAATFVVVLACSVFAVLRWWEGYMPLQQTFRERVFGHAPYTVTHPLADLHAWPRIEQVLRTQHKQFGGYLTSYWPMFNFMNAAFGYYNGGRRFWEHGGARFAPGYCVFWDHGKVDWWTRSDDIPMPLRNEVAALDARSDRACVSYRAHWNHAIERTLCHVCE